MKLRFRVLKAAGFRCFYCGRRPPECVLELEHVIPLALGGTWDDDNLRAACRDCNLGKGTELVPPGLVCLHKPPYRLVGGELLCGTCGALIAAVPSPATAEARA